MNGWDRSKIIPMNHSFQKPLPKNEQRQLLRGWLYLALASLIIPGITAILLVLLRTISVDAAVGWGDLFRSALVIHVDLSVFIWFLSIGGLLWTLSDGHSRLPQKRAAFWVVVAGSSLLSISPLFGANNPILNNYIPVLNQPLFFIGLILVWIGLLFTALLHLFSARQLNWGADAAAIATLLAIATLVTSWIALAETPLGLHYFERLFWGAGHILQFTYALLLLTGWKILSDRLHLLPWLSSRAMKGLVLIGALPLLSVPWLYLNYPPLAPEITVGFAQLMRYGNGVAPGIMGLLLLIGSIQHFNNHRGDPTAPPIQASLYASLLLFAAGGILALFISGINTIIPAHYHGSIVGITLAFMGLIYRLLPHLGFSSPQGRLATLQPYIYALGQLMHIAGLALTGSEGAQRKTAGVSSEAMNSLVEQVGLFLTRSGGLIAVTGGVLFLLVCWRSIRTPPEKLL